MLAAAIEPARRRGLAGPGVPPSNNSNSGPGGARGPGPGLGRSGPGRLWKARAASEARPQEASAPTLGLRISHRDTFFGQ